LQSWRETLSNRTVKIEGSDITMYQGVREVKVLEDYKLLINFENNENRILDMKPFLDKGIFRELTDKHIFNSVKVSFDTIEWCNSADMDPETVYERSVPA
jgi:hypothetical protein